MTTMPPTVGKSSPNKMFLGTQFIAVVKSTLANVSGINPTSE